MGRATQKWVAKKATRGSGIRHGESGSQDALGVTVNWVIIKWVVANWVVVKWFMVKWIMVK